MTGVQTCALPIYKIPIGLGHGRKRYKRARATVVTLLGVVPDVLRMMTFKSNDRLISLTLHHGAAGAGATHDIGLYLAGTRHNGAVVDDNLFQDNLDVAAATDDVDVLFGGTANFDELDDAGLQLWEMVNVVVPDTYASDPQVQFDLAITGEVDASNPITYTIEAEYIAGD